MDGPEEPEPAGGERDAIQRIRSRQQERRVLGIRLAAHDSAMKHKPEALNNKASEAK
jgi:hypothetical protein